MDRGEERVELMSTHPEYKYKYDTPVREFHMAFQCPIVYYPTMPPDDRRILRAKLIMEEAIETVNAMGFGVYAEGSVAELTPKSFELVDDYKPDLVKTAKELSDLRYVVDGSNLEWGIPQEAVLMETHRSNMSKLDANGKPIYRKDGKVTKSAMYFDPSTAEVLKDYGWDGQ